MNENSGVTDMVPPRTARKRTRKKSIAILVILFAVIFWFGHPPVFAWVLKEALAWGCRKAGLNETVERVIVRIGRPIRIKNLHVEADGSMPSQTRADASLIIVSIASPWEIFFGNGRLFNRIEIQDLHGVVDLSPEAMPEAVDSAAAPSGQEKANTPNLSRYLPEEIKLKSFNLQLLAADHACQIIDGNLTLSEDYPATLSLGEITITGDPIHQHFRDLKGITAWKDGIIYVAGMDVTKDVKIENFTADLARKEGIALGLDLHAFQGYLRGDISFGNQDGHSFIDSAFTVNQLALAPLPNFLGTSAALSGVLREARLTFHGNPGEPLKAQASLRIAADNVRWNKRGWDTLSFSANLVDGKIVIPEFVLRQLENRVGLTGQMTLPSHFSREEFEKADYALDGEAEIKDISSLAALLGEPFQETRGHLNLHTSVKGHGSDVAGSLAMDGANILYRGAPVDSVHIETNFSQHEAQITKIVLRNGKDAVESHAVLNLRSPFNYTGEVTVKIANLAVYLKPFSNQAGLPVDAGMIDATWQGDGTLHSHSGAFSVKVGGLVTAKTPGGIFGEFKGTYSPENVYFSKINLQHDTLALSLQSTLARSGIHFQNINLTAKNQPLADGSAFIPVDAVKLAQGTPWKQTILPNAQLYAKIQSRTLSIEDIGKIFGQKWTATGALKFELNGSGKVESPKIQGSLEGSGLGINSKEFAMPTSALSLTFNTSDTKAQLNGSLITQGFQPVRITASLPFHPKADASGNFNFLDPTARLEGTAEFPRTSLSAFRAFLPKMRRLTGILSGHLNIGNTLAQPQITGQIALTETSVEISTDLPRLDNLNAVITFENDQAILRRFTGAISAGPFDATGNIDFKKLSDVHYSLQFRGRKILLARDPSLRLRANVDFSATGDRRGGSVNGSIRFVDGRIYKRLEIAPLLIPTTVEQQAPLLLPDFSGKVPEPFAGWKLDVAINNETPFLMAGNLANGNITPKIRIGGTLGNPLPEGEVLLENFTAFLPFSTLTIQEGHIYLNPTSPRIPFLDIRATSEVQGYEIHAQAYGPMTENKFTVRSDPPLSQEAILLLLTTGIAPSSTGSGSDFGQAALGQGSLLILQALTKQFDRDGVSRSLANRVQLNILPAQGQTERTGLLGIFRVTKGFSLATEQDTNGFYNAGVIYTYRFR